MLFRCSEYRSQKRELTRLLREKEEEVGECSTWWAVCNHTESLVMFVCVAEISGRVDSLKKSMRESEREKRTVS